MTTNPPLKALILGSCVSRDILSSEGNSDNAIQLVDYYARSSLASLAGNTYSGDISDILERIPSKFQRRVVERDLLKSLYLDLPNIDFDILILDLIDERFDLFRTSTGESCTLSVELLQTGFLTESRKTQVARSGTEEHWDLWEKGWTKFITHLRHLDLLDRLIINKVRWSESTESGATFDGTYSPQRIKNANRLMARMHARIAEDIPSHQILEFADTHLVAADSHRWGISPFHYAASYYAEAVHQLKKISMAIEKLPQPTSREFVQQAYDIKAWGLPIHTHKNIQATQDIEWENGIHRINIDDYEHHPKAIKSFFTRAPASTQNQKRNLSIDIYANGVHTKSRHSNQKNYILIGMSGAVANRNGKKAPFFSGSGIAKSIGLPIIAISDPTLSLDPNLPLAWYSGSKEFPALQENIRAILENIARSTNSHLILFGGSGGGFAALETGCRLQCDATVLAWNPQTAISDYAPNFVAQYIEVAFPDLAIECATALSMRTSEQHAALRSTLEKTGVIHDIRKTTVPSNVRVIYLQNQSDWHVARHAAPYMEGREWQPHGTTGKICSSGENIGISFNNWGEGHVAPPKGFLEQALKSIAFGSSIPQTLDAIEANKLAAQTLPANTMIPPAEIQVAPKIKASATHIGSQIHAQCIVTSDSNTLTFAFYLLSNGQRHSLRWYEPSAAATFDVPNDISRLEVIAFCRDAKGQQSSVRVPVESSMTDEIKAQS